MVATHKVSVWLLGILCKLTFVLTLHVFMELKPDGNKEATRKSFDHDMSSVFWHTGVLPFKAMVNPIIIESATVLCNNYIEREI